MGPSHSRSWRTWNFQSLHMKEPASPPSAGPRNTQGLLSGKSMDGPGGGAGSLCAWRGRASAAFARRAQAVPRRAQLAAAREGRAQLEGGCREAASVRRGGCAALRCAAARIPPGPRASSLARAATPESLRLPDLRGLPAAGGAAMSVRVTLTGPAPWGFRITGGRDFRKPIMVSKVTEYSKAALGDLRPGDVIVSINGVDTSEMLNVEAQNKIKQSSGQLQLQVDRPPPFSPSQTNGESSPEMLSLRFQDVVRTRDDSQGALRSSHSSPASISPRPSSPYSPSSPGYQPCSPRGRQRSSLPNESSGESVVNNRSFQSLGYSPRITGQRSPSPHEQRPGSRQEWRSFSYSSGSPVTVLHPLNGSPSPGSYSLSSPWEMRKAQDRSTPSYSRRYSLDTEPTMRRLEGDSEVYKLMQENRESRAVPRQSSTFRMLQVALEMDEKEGTTPHFPSQLSPSTRKPASSSGAGAQKLHLCEKCGNSITTQAVRIQENRYRHPSCYICTDCGLNLKMRGHFWVGEEMFCEKHARLRYRGTGGDSTFTAVYSQS